MKQVFLIHGWSVTSTETYRELHSKLAEHGWQLEHVHLGRYVSLDNAIEIRDLAMGLQRALVDALGPPPWNDRIHFITHSTGALILRHWVVHHYRDALASTKAVGNIVFLAGPHGGSRLAHHGRSMIAAVRFLGDTGHRLLNALELGSEFTWQSNTEWMNPEHWAGKGIRAFCLTGDRVELDSLAQRIFSAGREAGSDMVVRVPAANLNMRRYRVLAAEGTIEQVGGISGAPFAALTRYTHSGPEHGIMNSISSAADPQRPEWQNLQLILDCLGVDSHEDLDRARRKLEAANAHPKRKGPYAQLVFRFVDQHDQPIKDFRMVLGRGKDESAGAVEHVHKNQLCGNRLVAFINVDKLDRRYGYFMEFHAETDSPLTSYQPETFRLDLPRQYFEEIVRPDEVTEIEVVLPKAPRPELFRFSDAESQPGHLRWGRDGSLKD
ncbi:esterase/lipase family protein [Wenzhouxiangella marina]|uniref:Uncharacterized protein n=1 Tax=Wenzhouxiangella marina TaxID=1579979 RepID=A0A0K0XZB3_9GAMM|nr:hypothetical protein [Wenzhouxiangella marina]AKS43028.1 hypothetical protein WM2015_2670 [Wenzhouxiangella marina]MBB6087289.1 hypothetical protein [Wenzhouxiangella marina]